MRTACIIATCATLVLAWAAPVRCATVSGRVIDGSTSQPIPAALVTLDYYRVPVGLMGTPERVGETSSGTDGRYTTATPHSGSHVLTVSHPGYRAFRTTRSIGSDDVVADVQLYLPATVLIHVTNAAGAPVAGARVVLRRVGEFSAGNIVSTDAEGVARFEGLAHGQYQACVRDSSDIYINECFDTIHQPLNSWLIEATSIAVAPGAVRAVTIALDLGGVLEGRLRDRHADVPLSNHNWSIHLFDETGQTLYDMVAGMTDATGAYRITGLRDASYKLEFFNVTGSPPPPKYSHQRYPSDDCVGACQSAQGAPITVAGAATVSNLDFDLFPSTVVSGRVTDATTGLPLAGVRVTGAGGFTPWGPMYFSATSDDAGHYLLRGVTPSYVRLYTGNEQGYFDRGFPAGQCASWNCLEATLFPLAEYEELTADFALMRGPSITGRVIAVGRPSPGIATVAIETADKRFASVNTRSDGTYRSPALASGTYFVRAGTPEMCRWHGGAACETTAADASPVVVEQADVTGIDVVLPLGLFHDSFEAP